VPGVDEINNNGNLAPDNSKDESDTNSYTGKKKVKRKQNINLKMAGKDEE
jgi:hypothetical protein